ncbi:hypothetical protein SCITRI_00100 [Spiroplasma citri]|nr:hypothetical protein SCITRI_00100 [Spiroplasma citri]
MQKHKLKNLNFKYFKKRYIFLNFILVVITFFLWFLLLSIIMQMTLSFLKGLLGIGIAGKIILILSSLVTLSLGIWLFTKYYQAAKLQKIIMQELPFEKFYQIGLNALTKNSIKLLLLLKNLIFFHIWECPIRKILKKTMSLIFMKIILITHLEH